MSGEVMLTVSRLVQILHRPANSVVANAAVVRTKQRAVGHQRVLGYLYADQAPASGFPRVRQSEDGVNWTRDQVIPQDLSKTNYHYPFDLVLRQPYVMVEWTQGGTQADDFRAWVVLSPVFGSGRDELPGADAGGIPSAALAQAADAPLLAASAQRRLVSYQVREAGAVASAAKATLRHGTGGGDPALAFVELDANGVYGESFGDAGLAVPNGVYLDVDAGTIDVLLRYKDA